MKRSLITILGCLIFSASVIAQVPSSGQNHIVESVARRPYKSIMAMQGKPVDSVNRTIKYFDGLGRPMQSIQWQGSPSKKDIVQHVEYDVFGRSNKTYLPYVHTDADGAFKTGGSASVNTFYTKVSGTDIDGIVRTPKPYGETVFDNSPLNRVLEQGAPGEAWQPAVNRSNVTTTSTTGHTVAMDYGTNVSNEVRLWQINATNNGASGVNYYAAGKLHKTVIKDENWVSANGKGGTVEEYKDFGNRVVLKRVWKSNTEALNTYYVYDDLGDLCYVVPPGYTTTTLSNSTADFNELIYAYRYDVRRRLIEKKIPGKGWEYIVYNNNDQPVLTQDAVQRATGKWSYTKYDAFGRVVSTGIYTNTAFTSQLLAQTAVNNHPLVNGIRPLWEDRIETLNYTNKAFPISAIIEYTVNYYDDYAFKTSAVLRAATGLDSTRMVKGLLTGTKIARDDGTNALLSANYYDKRGQLIQTISQNHRGGIDTVTNSYSFTGELLTTRHAHSGSVGGAYTTILSRNSYDHVGRLKEIRKKINSLPEILHSRMTYNEIGQLKTKGLHSENGGTSFITQVGYGYNERGWPIRIGSAQFTELLKYNDPTGSATAQYNGNIAQQLWGHAATTGSTFSYTYDRLNRLTNGTSTGTTIMIEALTYDDMGNIKTLARNTGNTTTTSSTTYTYNNSNKSNRLASLTGTISGTYTYDVNGNATKDRTGMTIRYNHLNLPDSVYNTGGTVRVGYLYDAMGTKLRKYSTQGGNRDYINGIEYSGNNIELIHMDEGIAYRNASNGTYTYRYNLTDHLGNVRSTVYRNPTTNVVEVLQRDDYYPFGKQRVVAAGNNKYLYNGKEIQGELGGQYDYGARFYDSEIGRWNVPDPLAEQMRRYSPYVYGNNNPLRFIDPDGMLSQDFLQDIWDRSFGDETTWTNEGDGRFSNGPEIVEEQQQSDQQQDPLKNSHGEKIYTLSEFLKKNKDLSYEEIINQRKKSTGLPGGPEMRYVLNPNDGNVMDMRHVFVVGYKGTAMGGVLVEFLQSLSKKTRGSAFDKQDFYSNNIGAAFFDFLAHPANAHLRKQDFTTVFFNYLNNKYTIPVWK